MGHSKSGVISVPQQTTGLCVPEWHWKRAYNMPLILPDLIVVYQSGFSISASHITEAYNHRINALPRCPWGPITDTSNSTYTLAVGWDRESSHLVRNWWTLKIVVPSVQVGVQTQKLWEVEVGEPSFFTKENITQPCGSVPLSFKYVNLWGPWTK